jgi:hypothetical protein
MVPGVRRILAAATAVTGIAIIVLAILVGPMFSAAEFSWLRHSTSEQAGQQLQGAWIMRAGFLAYGIGTLTAALLDWPTRPIVRAALAIFGLGLVATAIWSNASILPAASSDMHEDWLHSIASGVVGTGFAAACAARLFAPGGAKRDGLAWAVLLMSVSFPLAMDAVPGVRGLLQRTMFAVSFVFVGREFAVFRRRRNR